MNKKYVILIAILIIYFLILLLFLGFDKTKETGKTATILIDEETVWKLENNIWKNIIDDSEKEALDGNEFTVFVNYENIGKYTVEHNEKWNLYDKNNNLYSYEVGNLFAIKANYQVKLLNFNQTKAKDKKYINRVLAENNLTDIEEFTVDTLYKIDFDNDGIIENFYAISNAFARETSPKKVFSIVFMEKDGIIHYIYNSIENNDGQNGCKPYLNTAVDLTEDNIYELVVSCGYYSIQKRHDMLYKYKDNKFELILSNQ